MSFLLNSSGMRVSNSSNKVIFDSARKNPHIVGAITGTITAPDQPCTTIPQEMLDLGGGAQVSYALISCVTSVTQYATSDFIKKQNSFLMPFYRVTLPTTGRFGGAGVIQPGATNGKWVSASGGLLLRVFTARVAGYRETALQGSQMITATVPYDGEVDINVITNIYGSLTGPLRDGITPDTYSREFSQIINHAATPCTGFTVDFKIYYGLT